MSQLADPKRPVDPDAEVLQRRLVGARRARAGVRRDELDGVALREHRQHVMEAKVAGAAVELGDARGEHQDAAFVRGRRSPLARGAAIAGGRHSAGRRRRRTRPVGARSGRRRSGAVRQMRTTSVIPRACRCALTLSGFSSPSGLSALIRSSTSTFAVPLFTVCRTPGSTAGFASAAAPPGAAPANTATRRRDATHRTTTEERHLARS